VTFDVIFGRHIGTLVDILSYFAGYDDAGCLKKKHLRCDFENIRVKKIKNKFSISKIYGAQK